MKRDSPLIQETFRWDAGADETPVESIESRLRDAVEQCYRRAEFHFRQRFERPRLGFDLCGMTAAAAYPAQNTIRINRRLLQQNSEDFLCHTIPHEVSHLIAYRMHGRRIKPHGTEWSAIMSEVYGLEPLRCHDYDVRRNMKVAYRYRCGCAMEHTLGTRRHKSALRGRRYFCRRCRQPLGFSHREEDANRDGATLNRDPETTSAGRRK